jgi:Replication initiator protein A
MPRVARASAQLDSVLGRDEMNLAEFPIALLTNQEAEDRESLVYESRHGKLTITGTPGPRLKGNGLPNASDTDVLIGLIQLTKRANDFTDPNVHFSRYELLKIIRWPDDGRTYRRLKASLKRWTKVSLDYEKSWYDNRKKCRIDAVFHILNRVVVFERDGQLGIDEEDTEELPRSRFTWGDDFFKSCQQNYLKGLDLDVYFSLGTPATKQLYRFLDKHFYERESLTYDLRDLAVGHVGLSANYTIPRIKEKFAKYLDELEGIGFIEPASKEERYTKTGHGQWDITFRRKARDQGSLPEIITQPEAPLAQQLIDRGVTPITARELVKGFTAEAIGQKLEIFDWLMAKKDQRASKNPAGYLAKSIRDDFTTPKGFKSKAQVEADRQKAERAEQELAARRQDARSKDAKEQAEKAAVDAHLAGLTSEQRAELEREAFAASELDARLFGKIIVRDHVRKSLGFVEA